MCGNGQEAWGLGRESSLRLLYYVHQFAISYLDFTNSNIYILK